jgi:hypothetical protein
VTLLKLPMPGDAWGLAEPAATVVASVWGNDEPGDATPVWALLMLLVPCGGAPYYGLVEIVQQGESWKTQDDTWRSHDNILDAAEDYQQSGGG